MKKKVSGYYNMGGQTSPWMGLAQQAPQILDSIIGLFENNPTAYSRQPTLNANTMRQMVTPYAMGGQVDEEQMAELQELATQYGMTLEELLEQMQAAQQEGVEAEADIEEAEEETPDDIDQFAYGGVRKKKKGKRMYAYGGKSAPIEVEGKEVIETPDGNMTKVKGPSHEAGGVNINVPPGTKIFSDRLKIDGKSMQERKVNREKALARIEKALKTNPTDKITKSSYDRTLQVNQSEEMKDMALQKAMNALYNANTQVPEEGEEFAYGGQTSYKKYQLGGDPWSDYLASLMGDKPVNTPFLPGQRNVGEINVPDLPQEEIPEATSSMGIGDYIGLGGNLFNAIAPLINTQNMAAGMKPNVNRYLGFGEDALEANQTAQNIASGLKSAQLTDIETSAGSARLRNRNSARGISTLRALDTITDMGVSKSKQAASNSFSNTMMQLLGQRGQLENMQDRFEMAGETQRDIEDKADRDNYYSNMAQNLVNFGSNVQGIGKALNVNRSNKVDSKLLSQLSQYGLGIDDDGNLISTK